MSLLTPKKFYIKLTKGAEWTTEFGHSLAHIMQCLVLDFNAMPYNYIMLEDNPE